MTGLGIIGIGRHADRYLAPAIRSTEGVHLAAVVSRSLDRATGFVDRHGDETTRAYDDLAAFLADRRVEAVIIASPNGLHREHALAALHAGKPILLEKPMATSVVDAEVIWQAAQEAEITAAMGFHMRHHPAHAEARRLIASRALGSLLLAKLQYAVGGTPPAPGTPPPEMLAMMGGGIAMAIGVHLIDLVRYLTGRDVEQVTAICAGRPAEYQASVLLQLTGGLVAHLDCGRGYAKPANEVTVFGTEGTVVERGAVVGGHSGTFIGATVEFSNLWGSSVSQHSAEPVFANEIADFAAAIREGRMPLATLDDGIAAQRTVAALYESADTGQTVRI